MKCIELTSGAEGISYLGRDKIVSKASSMHKPVYLLTSGAGGMSYLGDLIINYERSESGCSKLTCNHFLIFFAVV